MSVLAEVAGGSLHSAVVKSSDSQSLIPSAGGLGRRFGAPRLTPENGDPTSGKDSSASKIPSPKQTPYLCQTPISMPASDSPFSMGRRDVADLSA